MSHVSPQQRFIRSRPCPICGGHDGLRRGVGYRCHGFLSDDGRYAHCTREELALGLEQHNSSLTFAHRLDGPCRCGAVHESGIIPNLPPLPSGPWRSRRRQQQSEPLGRFVCAYVYRDAAGEPLHRTLRFAEPKTFRQQTWRDGEWRWGLGDVVPVLYRLPELLAAGRGMPVFMAEGEKDCDRLAACGLVATTNAMGARNWQDHYTRWLAGRDVVLLEDNDEDGRDRCRILYRALERVVGRVRVVRFPSIWRGGDISDWLDAGGTPDRLLRRLGYRNEFGLEVGA